MNTQVGNRTPWYGVLVAALGLLAVLLGTLQLVGAADQRSRWTGPRWSGGPSMQMDGQAEVGRKWPDREADADGKSGDRQRWRK
jgi:hypothetical protein